MNNINTIIFDLGGVLIDLDRDACVKAFEQLGLLDADKYLSAYIQQGIFLELEEGKLSNEEFCNAFRKLSVNKQQIEYAVGTAQEIPSVHAEQYQPHGVGLLHQHPFYQTRP